jgi:hypothetical protein
MTATTPSRHYHPYSPAKVAHSIEAPNTFFPIEIELSSEGSRDSFSSFQVIERKSTSQVPEKNPIM